MADLTLIPAQDNFETTLSQSYNGAVGTFYVKNVPLATFPSGKKVLMTINGGKSNMQVVRVSAWDSTLKTMTVDSITVNKGNGLAYTQKSHSVGSKVIISDPYGLWEEMSSALSGKISTNSIDIAMGKFADPTARDAYFTSPVNGNSAYVTSLGVWTDYIGGAWTNRATGSTVNATTLVAGKVEIPTDTQVTNGDVLGETGASLTPTPAQLAKIIQSGSWLYAGASATGNDTYVVSMTPDLTAYTTGMTYIFKADVANTGACSINVDGLGAKDIKTISGADPATGEIPANKFVALLYDGTNMVIQNGSASVASNAEAIAGTDQVKFINSEQLKKYYGSAPTAGTDILVAQYLAEVSQINTTYVKKFEGTIVRTGTYTVSFELKFQTGGAGGQTNARVYKNGVAFGTIQTETSASYTTAKVEDLAFTAGDVISLYLNGGQAVATGYAKNFKVQCNQLQFTLA